MAEPTVVDEIRAQIAALPLAEQAKVLDVAAKLVNACKEPLFMLGFVLAGAELQELVPEGESDGA